MAEEKLPISHIRKFRTNELTRLNEFNSLDFDEGALVHIHGWLGPFDIQTIKERTSKNGNTYFTAQLLIGLIEDPDREFNLFLRLWENERWFFEKFARGEIKDRDYIELEAKWVKGNNYSIDVDHLEMTAMMHDPNHRKDLPKDNSSETGRFEIGLKTRLSVDSVYNMKFTNPKLAEDGYSGAIVTDTASMRGILPFHNALSQYNHLKDAVGMEMPVFDNPVFVHYPNDVKLNDIETITAFDTETTGLGGFFNDIVQMSAVKMRKVVDEIPIKKRGKPTGEVQSVISWQKIDELDMIVHSDKVLADNLVELTGIHPEDVFMSTVSQHQAVQSLVDFAKDTDAYVGHNVTFDMGMIKGVADVTLDKPVFDTLTMGRHFLPHKRSYKLEKLAKNLGIKLEHAHNSLFDAEATGHVFGGLLNLINGTVENLDITLNGLQQLAIDNPNAHNEIPFVKRVQLTARRYSSLKLMNLISTIANIHYFNRGMPQLPIDRMLQLTSQRQFVMVSNGGIDSILLDTLFMQGYEGALKLAKRIKFDFISIPNPQALGYDVESDIYQRDEFGKIFNAFKSIADELQVPLVVTNDIRKDGDQWLGAELYAGVSRYKNPRFFKTDELIEMFSYFTDEPRKYVVDNTLIVRGMIDEDAHYVVKPLDPPHMKDGPKILREKAYKRAHELYGKNLDKLVSDRIEKELNSIIESGYETVYLTVSDLVKYANSLGSIAGSRGSVGSSFVAFLIGITEVNALPAHYRSRDGEYVEFTGFQRSGVDMPRKKDPRPGHEDEWLIKDGHNLTYEIFAGIGGDKVPDIDLNFDGETQVKAWNWVRDRFGRDRVFRVGTTGTNTFDGAMGKLQKYYHSTEQGKKDKGKFDSTKVALDGAWHYTTNGRHAGGVYIVPENKTVYDFTPVQYPANHNWSDPNDDWMTTSLDKDTLHDSLLKLDILGHEDELMLKVMRKRAGMSFEQLKEIPLDDPKVIQFFNGRNNIGLPELGTNYLSGIIKTTKPKNFSDLVQIEGLAHSKTAWGDARGRLESGETTIADVIGTRDKIFNDLTAGGMSLAEANQFVEHVKKKKPFTDEMLQALRALDNLPDWYEDSLLNQTYMYPGAHAVAYAMSAWRVAWFKAHQILIFYATWMQIRGGLDSDMVRDALTNDEHVMVAKYPGDISRRVIAECLERIHGQRPGYQLFKPIDLNISKSHEYVIHDDHIYMPFSTLDGVSDKNAVFLEQLRDENEGKLTEDIIRAAPKRKLPTKAQNSIVEYINSLSTNDDQSKDSSEVSDNGN